MKCGNHGRVETSGDIFVRDTVERTNKRKGLGKKIQTTFEQASRMHGLEDPVCREICISAGGADEEA